MLWWLTLLLAISSLRYLGGWQCGGGCMMMMMIATNTCVWTTTGRRMIPTDIDGRWYRYCTTNTTIVGVGGASSSSSSSISSSIRSIAIRWEMTTPTGMVLWSLTYHHPTTLASTTGSWNKVFPPSHSFTIRFAAAIIRCLHYSSSLDYYCFYSHIWRDVYSRERTEYGLLRL